MLSPSRSAASSAAKDIEDAASGNSATSIPPSDDAARSIWSRGKRSGAPRYVVENEDVVCHIFNANQLELHWIDPS